MTKPKRAKLRTRTLRVYQHKYFREDRGAYGVTRYDRHNRPEIHILTPQALYDRVLRHELAHADGSRIAAFSDYLFGMQRYAITMTLILFLSTAIILFSWHSMFVGSSIAFLAGLLGSLGLIMLLSPLFYYLEEIRAERQARSKRRSRQMRRRENHQPPRPLESRE